MENKAEHLIEMVQSDHPVLRAIAYRALALAAGISLVLAVWAATSSPLTEAEPPDPATPQLEIPTNSVAVPVSSTSD